MSNPMFVKPGERIQLVDAEGHPNGSILIGEKPFFELVRAPLDVSTAVDRVVEVFTCSGVRIPAVLAVRLDDLVDAWRAEQGGGRKP